MILRGTLSVMGAALSSIHADVGHYWKMGKLASIATASRSGFAVRFGELVGMLPFDDVLRRPMQLARDALRKKRKFNHLGRRRRGTGSGRNRSKARMMRMIQGRRKLNVFSGSTPMPLDGIKNPCGHSTSSFCPPSIRFLASRAQ